MTSSFIINLKVRLNYAKDEISLNKQISQLETERGKYKFIILNILHVAFVKL